MYFVDGDDLEPLQEVLDAMPQCPTR